MSVTFDMPPDPSTVENAQPMEAINYFVEMELEKYMERMRLAAAREQASKEEIDDKKNTVLVLPKIRRWVSMCSAGGCGGGGGVILTVCMQSAPSSMLEHAVFKPLRLKQFIIFCVGQIL